MDSPAVSIGKEPSATKSLAYSNIIKRNHSEELYIQYMQNGAAYHHIV